MKEKEEEENEKEENIVKKRLKGKVRAQKRYIYGNWQEGVPFYMFLDIIQGMLNVERYVRGGRIYNTHTHTAIERIFNYIKLTLVWFTIAATPICNTL